MDKIMSPDDPDYIPDFEEFSKAIERIYPIGDMQKGFRDMLFHVNNHKMQNGDPVTWKVIHSQFDAHIAWWDYMYKSKERKGFLQKESETKRYSIDLFIVEKMYNRVWTITKGNKGREDYIFSKIPITILMEQLDKFKLLWKGKSHHKEEDQND